MKNYRSIYISLSLFILIIFGFFIGVLFGPTNLSLSDLNDAIFTKGSSPQSIIVWDIRMPRIFIAITVGAVLALSGSIIQVTTRNPLGDPQLFGITGGALIVNALVISGKINLDPWFEITFGVLASIIGAIIIYFCASREDLKISTLAIIGFSLGAMCVAISTGIMAYSRVFTQQALSVIGGSTANLNWDFLFHLIPFMFIGILIVFFIINKFDILVLGDQISKNLGVDSKKTRLIALIAAAIMSGSSVGIVGSIGLLGLITPHITRIIIGNNIRKIIIYSLPIGGLIMLYSDQISRLIFMPNEVPVGLVITILGAPIMMYLSWRYL